MMSVGGPGAGVAAGESAHRDAPLSQKIIIERDDRMVAEPTDASDAAASPEKLAALSSDDADALAPTEFTPAVKPGRSRRANHAREWRDERPRRSGSSGRSRRGDPRPGTMRYNVAQVLGGIY